MRTLHHFFSFMVVAIFGLTPLKLIQAAETDQYQVWGHELKDSTEILNVYINKEIHRVIKRANRKMWNYSCPQMVFKIGMNFSHMGILKTDIWASRNSKIDKYPGSPFSKSKYHQGSIYRNVSRLLHLGRTFKVNGVHIGVDKLSHSLAFGFVYFMKYWHSLRQLKRIYPKATAEELDQKAMIKVVRFGIHSEQTYVGMGPIASGVFSQADLEANFQGFLIYKNMCYGQNPSLQKKGKDWVLPAAPIDMRNHVNPNWDETFNLNYYIPKIWKKVKPHLLNYCQIRTSPEVLKLMEFYKQNDKPSFSKIYLNKMLSEKKIPNPNPQSLESICVESSESSMTSDTPSESAE